MPTGYTSKLYEGEPQTLPEFILDCARAFGALIIMRDEPADAPIPDKVTFRDEARYRKYLEESNAELDQLMVMSARDKRIANLNAHEKRVNAWRESQQRADAIRRRYDDMLVQVMNWDPPTPDHERLKKFMVDQLRDSMAIDCNTYPREYPVLADHETWWKEQVKRIREKIARDEKSLAEAIEREASRQAWVDALRDSLKEIS